MRVAIIGAGVAGAAAGQRFKAAGYQVSLFDKGRGAGGRLATRRASLGDQTLRFDHGAPGVPVGSGAYGAWIERAITDGAAARWDGGNPDAHIAGLPATKALVVHALDGLNATFGVEVEEVSRQADGWWIIAKSTKAGPFDAVLVTVPAPQVPRLVAPHDLILTEAATSARYDPCWTVMLAYPDAADAAVRAAAGIHNAQDLTVIADHAKPMREGPPRLVVHAGPERTKAELEAEKDHMAAEFAREVGALGCHEPIFAVGHRWRYCRVAQPVHVPNCWGADGTLGVAGDWTAGSTAEDAFMSGEHAAESFIAAN